MGSAGDPLSVKAQGLDARARALFAYMTQLIGELTPAEHEDLRVRAAALPDLRRFLLLCGIFAERAAQDAQWGGPDHDDVLHPAEWRDLIAKHLRRGYQEADGGKRLDLWRRALVKVAALALAALEVHDRWAARQEVTHG